MKTIKFLKEDRIELDGIVYRPYKVCDIPQNFGCITFQDEKEGISEWFNYKGYTYPIKDSWSGKKIRVASFKTGYVRNQNSCHSAYQLNKTKKNFKKEFGNGYKYYSIERILIPNEKDRLEYLISYCLKNYYINKANKLKWENKTTNY